MKTSRRTLLKNSAAAAAALSLDWRYAQAQAETVRIGVIFDHSGPFAAGAWSPARSARAIAIDLVPARRRRRQIQVAPINADSQAGPMSRSTRSSA
jgi:branched-chain amino acid transport system substrate-binding protein